MQAQSRAVILARVSSRVQETEGYSLDSQVKLLRDYCKSKGLNIVKEFRITETASKQQCRKEFKELLTYITKHRIYHFVAEKTDRLTRNLKDAAYLDDWLEQDGQRVLHCVKEDLRLYRGSQSQAKLIWGMNLIWAKQYTDKLREEAMKGWAEKLAQGWLPASPPPGYMTVTEQGKKIHVPNPATMALMQRTFKLYLAPDHTLRSIAKEMEAMGVVNSKGNPYCKSQVFHT